MIICLDVPVIVDRIEEDIAVLEVGSVTFDVPLVDGLVEGATLRLCWEQRARSAAFPVPATPITLPGPG